MADIERAGLPFFNIVETPKSKRRRVEISPFVQVSYIEEEDDDFSEEEDLSHDDPVHEVELDMTTNTAKTPIGDLKSASFAG